MHLNRNLIITVKTNMKRIILIISTLTIVGKVIGQTIPIVFTNATIHIGNGKVLPKGIVIIHEGKIIEAAEHQTVFYKNARVIDLSGKDIYPGLINLCSYAGLTEIDAARATHDFSETGDFNPNVRSAIAYNTDSKVVSTLKSNGILLQQTMPVGGRISGSSSCMKTFGWNWEDALYKSDEGIHIHWPELPEIHREESDLKAHKKHIDQLTQFVQDAKVYRLEKTHTHFNARLESMIPVWNGQRSVYMHVQTPEGILEAIAWLKQYPEWKIVLVGIQESEQVTEAIIESGYPVVCHNLHRLPTHSGDDVKQAYKQAEKLVHNGVLTCIALQGSWETRNLSYIAGTAAAYGLSKEEALQCITLNPAKVMGIDSQTGSIEKGKEANILITEGDVLDMKSSRISSAYFRGEEISLKNFQEELSEKFSRKPKP